MGRDSSVGIATDYGLNGPEIESWCGEIFRTLPDWPFDPPNLLCHGYRVFPGANAPGSGADDQPPSSAEDMNEYSYTSIPLWAFGA
jgi:hypothetical protein